MSSQVKVLKPSGLMDSSGGSELRREIIDALELGAKTILVNFQDVTFMDSSGLGTLVAALQRVRVDNAQLYLCSLNDQLKIILELTRLDQAFDIFSDQAAFEAAVASIN